MIKVSALIQMLDLVNNSKPLTHTLTKPKNIRA